MLVYCGCQGDAFNLDVGGTTKIIEKAGELEKNEVWSGRIYITDTVVIPEGTTLTIRSGTIVGFEPLDTPSQIIVHGELYAEGAPDRLIVFGSLGRQPESEQMSEVPDTAAETGYVATNLRGNRSSQVQRSATAAPPKAGDWEGIQVESTSPNSRFTYCRIQHATIGITCRTDAVQIERCLFRENKIGVLSDDTRPTITSNEFNRNGTGSQFRGSASPDVEYNEFTANNFGIICQDDARPRILYNVLRANYDNAIVCYSTASPEIVSNNITMNIGWAVYDGGRLRDNFIQGNKEVGPGITELSVSTQSDQYYSVDEVFDPRNSPVVEAGVPNENF